MPTDNIPAYEQFISLPYFDQSDPRLIGRPYLMGKDDFKNDVYFMGLWNQRDSIKSSLIVLLQAAGINDTDYKLQDAFPVINFSTKFGGLLSKRFNLTSLGRRMLVWGIQRRYYEFVNLVDNVKTDLE